MPKIKKISVIGAGAIGAMFGGLIKHHDPSIDVTMIARGEHLRAMQESGHVRLRGIAGGGQRDHKNSDQCSVRINASSDPADVEGSDLILFSVKTQDTIETARRFADHFGDALVVSLQNGINQRLLADHVRAERLLVGMTATNMAIVQPGVVDLTRRGVSVIGAASPEVSVESVERARRILDSSGLAVKSSSVILGVQYNKLLFNTMGYASVLSATDFLRDGILNRPWRTAVAMPILAEGFRVLQAAGIRLEKAAGGSDVIRLNRLMRGLAFPGLGSFVRVIARGPIAPPRLVFSVYLDLIRNRPTEIDYVNGEIVRLAGVAGVAAPYNAEVVRRVHELEQSELEPSRPKQFPSREEIVRSFGTLGNRR